MVGVDDQKCSGVVCRLPNRLLEIGVDQHLECAAIENRCQVVCRGDNADLVVGNGQLPHLVEEQEQQRDRQSGWQQYVNNDRVAEFGISHAGKSDGIDNQGSTNAKNRAAQGSGDDPGPAGS